MKKSLVITALFLIGLYANVMAGSEPACYVKTAEDVYFGQKLKIGLLKTKIISEDGKIVKVPNKEVLSYTNGSRLFELLPLVDNDPETPELVFMECITSRSGHKLYCYENNTNRNATKEYFVYRDGKLHVRINQTNAASILRFFGKNSF